MSSASPEDLAVAFRSFQRRIRDAQGEAPQEHTSGLHGQVRELLDEAGRLLGTPGDPAAVATAIESIPADHWEQAVLDRLRTIALDLGGLIRQVARLTGTD